MSSEQVTLVDRLQDTGEILLHYFPLHSALAEWGKPLEVHLSAWIIDHPEEYQDALLQSFDAGCDLASTSTQASSPWRAEVFGLRHRVREMNLRSAQLARKIMPPNRYLCGFVSSTNPDFLQPLGSLTSTEVYDGYTEQISALLEGGVDCIMVVGNHLDESTIAVRVAKDLGPVPVVAQNVFYHGKQGYRTMMGHDVAVATRRLVEAGADVVGASCGLMKEGGTTPGDTGYYQAATQLVRELHAACRAPISIQPNAGMAQISQSRTLYPASPRELVDEVGRWIEAGARIVGGCCGTNLGHYRAIAPAVRAARAKREA